MASGKDSTTSRQEKNGSAVPALVDPHGIGIQFVDSLITLGSVSGIANLVVGTRHVEPRADGAPNKFVLVAARLRFTPQFARQLRDSLDKMLASPDTDSKEASD